MAAAHSTSACPSDTPNTWMPNLGSNTIITLFYSISYKTPGTTVVPVTHSIRKSKLQSLVLHKIHILLLAATETYLISHLYGAKKRERTQEACQREPFDVWRLSYLRKSKMLRDRMQSNPNCKII